MALYDVKNIFINEFSPTQTYNKYNVVYVLGGNQDVYVSLKDNNLGNSILNTSFWVPLDGLTNFHEIWTPTYSTSLEFLEDSLEIELGDGYKQHISFGLNTNKHNFKIVFKNISDIEAKSLLVFFEYKQGLYPFYYKDNDILAKKKYVCKTWKHVFQQYNRNDVNVIFEEYFSA